ncbi:MAG: hypothetical protein JO346_05895, partial [Alphaproteobacteria bacterium]|nr:hypothetical protein [Alphaproteobacteria bacterium]
LSEIWFKHDPFDLALTRMDKKTAKTLPAILTKRLEGLKALLRERKRSSAAHPNVPLAKQWVFRHTEARLEAEVAYLTDLLKVADKFAGEKPLALPK